MLQEISIVKNPSNYSATLSLAKSFNAENKVDSDEGEKMACSEAYDKVTDNSFNALQFVSFNKGGDEKKVRKFDEAFAEIDKAVEEVIDKEINVDMDGDGYAET